MTPEHIVIRQKIKDLTKGMSISKNYASELDGIVVKIIEKSVDRAKRNHRNTVMARDL